MYLVQRLTSDTLQKQVLILPDGTQATIVICYKPLQYGWFIQELTWEEYSFYNIRICTSPNILYQWRNILTFGLSCITLDGNEPMLQKDFSSEYASLYILSQAEVENLVAIYNE